MTLMRSAVFNLYFFGLTFVLSLVGTALRFGAPERVPALARQWATWVIGAARVICGIRLEISGLARLPAEGPLLIASRHQSALDTIIWLTLLPRCCYVLKQELIRIPLYGGLIRHTGMIVVDREAGAAAMRHLLREADRAMREQRQVVIFPEGTRAEPGAVLPLQPGVAALAARTGLPVFPVITDSGRSWGRRAFAKHAGVVHIHVLPPIPAGTPRAALMQGLDIALRREIAPSAGPVDNYVG